MPQLGETVTEGRVTAWRKKIGDAVAQDEILFDVETEKVAMEIPAPASGVLAEILVPEGETVEVGTRLAVIQTAGGSASVAATVAAAVPPAGSQSAAPSWPRVPTAAPSTQPQSAIPSTQPVSPSAKAVSPAGEDMKLSPVVRRLLAEHKLDPAQVKGSGKDGRITREDVLAYVAQGDGGYVPAPAGLREVGKPADQTVLPLNHIRQRTGAQMLRSWTTIPHVLQAVEVDFHNVDEVRRAHGAAWKARERFALTYLPFIARAVCEAVKEFPHVNARIDGDKLIVHGRVNLGIAVDLSHEGLIVPVVKDAQIKSLAALARAMHELIDKARGNRLKPDDLTEGTYTISNSGPFGTLITAPIINPPQVAILSTDGVRKKPVVIEGEGGDAVAIRPVGVLAQSFDHRAFDGAYSAAFLRRVKEILEQKDWRAELA